MKKLLLLCTAALLVCACGNVKKNARGVTVRAENGQIVRLEAVNADIIRVSAVPEGKFSEKQSLAVLDQPAFRGFKVSQDEARVLLTTDKLVASVSKTYGTVEFRDRDGNLLSAEDRREFAPISVEGTDAWTVRQVFASDPDEGFFGLGQHQADEWNYKGKNEELYQYNTKISVPFIVSTKRYGILWDSYSFCRWGDPRDYAQLGEVFKLYDKDGVEGALTGTYVPAVRRPDGPDWPQHDILVRREEELAQEFLITPECRFVRNAPKFLFAGSHVTFEGDLLPREDGVYRFLLYYAGYMKVYMDGEEVVPEIWRTAWNPNSWKFSLPMETGRKVHLKIEWAPDGGTSYCALRVLSPVAPEEQAKMSWWGEMQDQIDYYFIHGADIDGVIGGYRTLTGKAQIMPKWAMGYWQSRERYTTQHELVSTLAEFRERHIPVDNIVQDWQYWKQDSWGSHEFEASRYPSPKAMVDSVHAMNGRFMISVWPKFYTSTEHFREFDEKGWMYRVPVDDNVIDWLGFQQSFYDAYAEGARRLFWDQMKEHLFPLGVDAWWMDASEPNIHDCTDMDYRKAMQGPTALGPSTQYFNAYALMNAQAIYEGQRAAAPDQRVFLLTRNGFLGLQRYSTASWSGDIGTRWEDMKTQISAGLNYSISGIPFWTQDVGGFSVENRYSAAQRLFDRTGQVNADLKEWRELQTRWHEWGIFNPLYRAHGQFPYREPWNIAPAGDPAYEAILAADRLRYRLMPYIYTLDARVHFDDYTIMRPLVMDFTDDPVAVNTSDEYMFGDALLVCPVYQYGARSREVYLPAGGWYEFHTGRYLDGGRTLLADAPYERIPLYVRAGRILVCGPAVESTAETGDGSLDVTVYGGADADFRLYEDDGLTYGYERGEYATIPMHWDDATATLTIGARQGCFDGMVASRRINVSIVSNKPHADVLHTVQYDGSPGSVKL